MICSLGRKAFYLSFKASASTVWNSGFSVNELVSIFVEGTVRAESGALSRISSKFEMGSSRTCRSPPVIRCFMALERTGT